VSVSRAQPVTTGSQEIEAFDVSADGRWLVFDSDRGGTQQLYRMPLAGGDVEQLTDGDEPSLAPAFSPDAREIVYHAFRNGIRQIFVMPAEGGTPVQVTAGNTHSRAGNWSPDGRSLTFAKDALTPTQEVDIVSRDAKGQWGSPRTLLKSGELSVWSPDGRHVVSLMKADGGRMALVTVPTGGGAPRIVVPPRDPSATPGYTSAFSPDGRFIYYVSGDPEDHKTGIWRVPASGGAPRLMAWSDNPSGGLNRAWFRVRGNRFYFTLGDPQSDIWMTELMGSR
jgi:Tol biopolymer transport system component